MNKVVREHYPVSKLPEELQREFAGFETVKIVTEEEELTSGSAAVEAAQHRYDEYLREIAMKGPGDTGAFRGRVTVEDAVQRVRELRDEWDD